MYIISNIVDLISDHMKMTNRMQCVLGAIPTIVLTNYQVKRKKGVDWYSPPYYTHSHGYKMCVNVYLMPSHTDLHVYSYLLPGEYDDGLKWPFRGRVAVWLLNQLSDDNHYKYMFDYEEASKSECQRVTSRKRSDWMSPIDDDLPLTALKYNSSKKCQYLKNDCLKFKIIVQKV